MITIRPGLSIDEPELQEAFLRASGPGGQNVNKLETAVQLRFDARASPGLTAAVRERLLRLAGRRATKDGIVVITAQRFRTRERNREDARERLLALLFAASAPPSPPRRATAPSRAARERRQQDKLRRAGVKALRGRPAPD